MSYSRTTGLRSSIAVHVLSERGSSATPSSTAASVAASDAIPLLTRGNSFASSIGSADTSAASGLDGGYVLETQDNGLLTLPERFMPHADLLCPFQILDCDAVFSDVISFKTHVFSHFRGHAAPKSAACFLCDMNFEQIENDHAALAWNNMLSHLANDHFRQGQRLATVRTDFGLMRWMYARRIISDHQFKRTQLCALPTWLPNPGRQGVGLIVNTPLAPMPPSSSSNSMGPPAVPSVGMQNEAYTLSAGRRAERRRRDATRSVHG